MIRWIIKPEIAWWVVMIWLQSPDLKRISRLFFPCVCLLLVVQRPPVLVAAPADTEALSQGCGSALLCRDNDKALNPSVELTFVTPSHLSLFLNCLVRLRVAIGPLLGGLGVCLGRGDFWSPALFSLAAPQVPHSCWQKPAWSTRYPKSLCGVCYRGGKARRKEKKRGEKRKIYFCLRRTLRVWSLVTQTCYRSLELDETWRKCSSVASSLFMYYIFCYTASHI